MKQYVIDELRIEDYEKLKIYLNENYGSSEVEGVYWIPIKEEVLTEIQNEHIECRPFYFVVVLEVNLLACELLVRTRNRIRCNCISYATENQRNWLISFIDKIFEQLEIIT